MNKKEGIASAIISVAVGLMLIIMKDDVISIALTVLGVAAIVSAILDFIHGMPNLGLIKAVIGVCILVFGWMFVNLALYILAASIILVGLLQIFNIHKFCPVNMSFTRKILTYIKPVITVMAGACLLFNQGGTIAWIFAFTGVLLIIEGVLEIIAMLKY